MINILLTILSTLAFTLNAYSNTRDEQCRAKASIMFNNCLAGAIDDSSVCRTQTRCEDLCLGGKRICRVFDCNGSISSEYSENCLSAPPTFACSRCEMVEEDYFNNRVKACFKVFETTNGNQTVVQETCETSWQNCDGRRKIDLRCR